MVWDDAPSHICRGGDIRALTFCCPSVKPCPLLKTLDDLKLSPQEYMDIKENFAKKTRLSEGAGTCFGSLVWCCKTSKPCSFRDRALKDIDMSADEYLALKKQLAEKLIGSNLANRENNINALADAFSISNEKATKVLHDCDNDLRKAINLLRMKALEPHNK